MCRATRDIRMGLVNTRGVIGARDEAARLLMQKRWVRGSAGGRNVASGGTLPSHRSRCIGFDSLRPQFRPGMVSVDARTDVDVPVTNTLSDVSPSPVPPGSRHAIVTAWTGGCVDQDRGELILAANGGHTDYAGNEVYACQLCMFMSYR